MDKLPNHTKPVFLPLKWDVVGRKLAPQRQDPVSRTCAYVTLDGKRYFSDRIKVRDVKAG